MKSHLWNVASTLTLFASACTGRVLDLSGGVSEGGAPSSVVSPPDRDEAGLTIVTVSPPDNGPEAGPNGVVLPPDRDPEAGTSAVALANDGGDASDADANAPCGCTRRPGAGNSFQCPAGVGEHTTMAVGSDGGSVTLEGRQGAASGVAARLDFPPTALASSTTITLTETTIPPPQDLLDWSPVYRVDPVGLALAQPVTLWLPWSNADGVANPSIWFSPDGISFTPVADSYTNAGFDQGSIKQLGYLIVAEARTASTLGCP